MTMPADLSRLESEAVTLWRCPTGAWGAERCHIDAVKPDEEYRALPAASFNTLLSLAKERDALAERDAERKGVIDAALCQRIAALEAERDAAVARAEEAMALLKETLPALREYARANPKWIDHKRGEQDPSGVHALLTRIDTLKALGAGRG